jgi:hypothetical protein
MARVLAEHARRWIRRGEQSNPPEIVRDLGQLLALTASERHALRAQPLAPIRIRGLPEQHPEIAVAAQLLSQPSRTERMTEPFPVGPLTS